MAIFNGKEGRWVTTKEGKHRFIEGAEDLVDKRDRDIAEQEERTRKLTAEKQGKDDKPDGKPIDTYPTRYDGHTNTSRSFDKFKNGYFVREVKFDKDGNVVSDTYKRISKEDYEHARGADHAKMRANDFTSQISSVRGMPEKTLRDIKKKNEAYLDLINKMKKSGYQGSEDKDYNDVITEFSKLSGREYSMKKASKTRNK